PAPKMYAGLAASPDLIIANEVVRIAVAEGHSIIAIFDHVLLVKSVLRSPTEIDALGAVPHPVAADNRTLRPRTRVQGESSPILQMTVLHEHVMGNAPDDSVAIKIPHG